MEAQNTQKKAQHSIRIFAWLVPLAVAIVIGNLLFRLGMRFIPGLNPVYAWISLGVQLLLYAVSAITVFRRWHKYNNVRLKDMRDRLLQKKKRVDRGEKGLNSTLALSVIGCFVWIFLCIAAAVATLFFSGADETNLIVCIPCTLISVFTLWGISATLISFAQPNKTDVVTDILPRERFPLMYQTLDEVFSDEKQMPLLSLFLIDNVAVRRSRGRVVVGVGAMAGAFMNREELKQVLLHEKAHIIYDRKLTVRISNGILKRFHEPSKKSVVLKPTDVLFLAPLSVLSQLLIEFQQISSEKQELLADRFAMQNGKTSESAAALVKMQMLGLYLKREATHRVLFYETEEIQKDFITREFETFRNLCPKRQQYWSELLMKQLPALINSHPTLPQRLHQLNDPKYEITFGDPDPKYCEEQKEFLRFNDELLVEQNEESFGERRLREYLQPMEQLERYLAEADSGITHSPLQLRPVIEACLKLEREDLAILVCEQAIDASESESEAAYANYIKGRLLLNRYDPDGIAFIKRAAEANPNFVEPANNEIGDFCLMMGMQKELEDYRQYIIELAQKKIDDRVNDADSLSTKDKLSGEPVLPEDELQRELAFIKETCGEHLYSLHRITKQLSASLSSTVYIVRFVEGTDDETRDRCMERIFEYLDGLDAQYSLFDYEYAAAQKIRLDRIKGALIYQKES